MKAYTLPPLPPGPFNKTVENYGQQCAESARAPLLGRIAELSRIIDGWIKEADGLAGRAEKMEARIAELDDLLRFVERWANHHGAKPCVSAKEALSVIQHHPAISDITRSYADGKPPETFNPYARIAELEADAKRQRNMMRALRNRLVGAIAETSPGSYEERIATAEHRVRQFEEAFELAMASRESGDA